MLVRFQPSLQTYDGGLAEWFMAAVLKTVGCKSPVGSNPTPSALAIIAIVLNGRVHLHTIVKEWISVVGTTLKKLVS